MQDFLSGHRRARVVLLREHGKRARACVRRRWELGYDPGLRVRRACATDALVKKRGNRRAELVAEGLEAVLVRGEE